MIFSGYDLSNIAHWPNNNKIIERPMRAELIQKIGSDKENEDFFNPESFAVDRNGRIFILDTGNSRIQCFSKEGKFQFSFGRRGQGPGELSNQASNIKILNDGNIYVIDNRPRRINVYNLEGKYQHSIKIPRYYDDIVLLNKTYYLCGILLHNNFKPIDFTRTLDKIEGSFGVFIEPAVGLVKRVDKLPFPAPWYCLYMGATYTNLIVTPKNELIYSQGNPYRLIKYDFEGRVLKDIVGNVGLDTSARVEFIVEKETVGVLFPNQARVFHMSIKGDDQLIVPFLNQERDLLFIDIYDLDLNFISRHKMPNIVNYKIKDRFRNIIIDDNNNLFGLVTSQENPAQLVKYKLVFD
jgi:hypothetical protein